MTDRPASTQDPDPLEADLRRALRPLRPAPEAFLDGVRERIAAREAEAARFSAVPARLRWAASWMPPGILGVGVKAAGAAGTKLSWKAAPGMLALPAVSVLMLLLTFFGAARTLWRVKAEPQAAGRRRTDSELVVQWWERNRLAALVALGLIALLALTRHPETIVVVLLGSMATAALLLVELARHGLAERTSVGRTLARMLYSVGLYWFLFRDFLPRDPRGTATLLGPAVLWMGGVGCVWLSGAWSWNRLRQRLRDPIPMNHPDPITTGFLRALMAIVVAVVVLVLGTYTVVAVMHVTHPASRAHLARWVARFDAETTDEDEWRAYARAAAELAADGGPAPDLRALDAGPDAPGRALAAVLLDRADRATIARFSERRDGRVALEIARAKGHGRLDLDQGAVAAVRALLAVENLDLGARERLARAVVSAWPAPDGFDALAEMESGVALLALLGHEELVPAGTVAEALRLAWRGRDQGRGAAGFSRRPVEAGERSPYAWRSLSARSDAEATLHAVRLMRRLGVPPEIDLARVREAALTMASGSVLDPFDPDPMPRIAEAALVGLEPLAPTRYGLASWIVEQRVLLGAGLLALLCVVATARAPRAQGVRS